MPHIGSRADFANKSDLCTKHKVTKNFAALASDARSLQLLVLALHSGAGTQALKPRLEPLRHKPDPRTQSTVPSSSLAQHQCCIPAPAPLQRLSLGSCLLAALRMPCRRLPCYTWSPLLGICSWPCTPTSSSNWAERVRLRDP